MKVSSPSEKHLQHVDLVDQNNSSVMKKSHINIILYSIIDPFYWFDKNQLEPYSRLSQVWFSLHSTSTTISALCAVKSSSYLQCSMTGANQHWRWGVRGRFSIAITLSRLAAILGLFSFGLDVLTTLRNLMSGAFVVTQSPAVHGKR